MPRAGGGVAFGADRARHRPVVPRRFEKIAFPRRRLGRVGDHEGRGEGSLDLNDR
jgi:hypothetical protein